MLDIVIAIFLIYALFAGLVSGINELLVQVLEMRGKILFEGIAMLLGELPQAKGMKWWLSLVFLRLGFVKPFMAEGAHLTQALYGHPIVDTLSQPGSKPSYIAPASFAAALVQILEDGGSLAALQQKLADRTTSLGRLFGPMLDEANGDIERFKTKVETQFNLVMDRVGGWYKRRAQAAMGLIGLTLAVSLNVDTIYILQRLQDNPELVAPLLQAAEKISAVAPAAQNNPHAQATENNIAATETTSGDEQINTADGNDAGRKYANQETLTKQIAELNSRISEFKNDRLPIGWVYCAQPPEKQADEISDTQCKHITDYSWLPYYRPEFQNRHLQWIGWILTALAGMLGAPFWFDAISMLFAIRGAGRKPDDSAGTSAAATPTVKVVVTPGNSAVPGAGSAQND